MAQLIDGKAIAAGIRHQVAADVAAIEARGGTVDLVSVMVGKSHAGEIYSRSQASRCSEVGIRYELRALPDSAPAYRPNGVRTPAYRKASPT